MKTDYNQVSKIYDIRYKDSRLLNVENKLFQIIKDNSYKNILEVGCGTGYWLDLIKDKFFVSGVDFSTGMLKKAYLKGINNLICADANNLPIKNEQYDLIFCVNAVHHFSNPFRFIEEAYLKLKKGGMLCIFGINPVEKENEWYIFKYFAGTYEVDKKRFPETNKLIDTFVGASFQGVKSEQVDLVEHCYLNEEVFDDIFLIKDATSELHLISQVAYDTGISLMKNEIAKNLSKGIDTEFKTKLYFNLIAGIKY